MILRMKKMINNISLTCNRVILIESGEDSHMQDFDFVLNDLIFSFTGSIISLSMTI